MTPRQPAASGSPPEVKLPLPADRAAGLARAAHQRLNGALVRCEERYPLDGAHSVILVVVDHDAAGWRERLSELHADYFRDSDPLAPVRLEVIDRATDAALARLSEAGLVALTSRGARPLFPAPAALSPEKRARAASARGRAARHLKMAQVLGEGGFGDEARTPLLEAALALGCALAIENQLPEPQTLVDSLRAPLASLWSDCFPELQLFINDPARPWQPVAERLGQI